MCTNIGAVSVLALLLALSAARAGAGDDDYYHSSHNDYYEDTPRQCAGDQPPPKMNINQESIRREGYYVATYAEKIVIHCSGEDIRNIKIKVNGQPIQAVTINKTTVQLEVYKPDLGYYEYICTDRRTTCKDTLTVEVKPAMSVHSPRALYNDDYYFVPHGEEYQVLCSGHAGASLQIKDVDGNELQTNVINGTTSMYTKRAGRGTYWCRGKGATVDGEEKYVMWSSIKVTVDYYPQGEHFRCIIHDWYILECSWRYQSDRFTFSLFYTDPDDNNKGATLLCDTVPNELNITCKKNIQEKGHETFTLNQNISLLLVTCYEGFCYNETFNLNSNSLLKLRTVSWLEVKQTTSHEAVLRWGKVWIPSASCWAAISCWPYRVCDTCVYIVEFRLPAFRDEWRQADTTSVRCDNEGWCELALPLLYPDTEYEVRVYQRHKDATDDRVWSDPASVFVRTECRAESACDAAFHTPAGPTASTEKRSYEACTLTERTINESLKLKNKIKSLKAKLAKAKEIVEILSKTKQMIDRLKTLG